MSIHQTVQNRNALATSKRRLKCPVSERTIKRQSRQQRFWSTRCRMKAFREKIPAEGGYTGGVTKPPKSSNENNVLQWRKSRSRVSCRGVVGPRQAIETEVIAVRIWDEVTSSDG